MESAPPHVPSVLFLFGQLTLDQSKTWLLLATVVWFTVTPFWMGRPVVQDDAQ